jgi:hypothetical protein
MCALSIIEWTLYCIYYSVNIIVWNCSVDIIVLIVSCGYGGVDKLVQIIHCEYYISDILLRYCSVYICSVDFIECIM